MTDPLLAVEHLVLADEPLEAVLDRVAHAAVAALAGSAEVSVTLIEGDRPVTAAATGPMAEAADALQYEHGYGPCLDASRTGQPMVTPDMAAETRWPAYAEQAVALGVRSSISFPLPIQDERIGALNVFGREPHAFGDDVVERGQRLASLVAVALHNARVHGEARTLAAQLREAMESRAVIEQAKGVLMAQHAVDADAAIALLIRASQHRNVKLRVVAAQVVESAASGTGGGLAG